MQKVDILPHGPTKKGKCTKSAFDFTWLLIEWLSENPDKKVVCTTFLPDKTQVGHLMIIYEQETKAEQKNG